MSDKDHRAAKGWTPSIHMPRSASRLNLLVKRVWVERVRDISEEGAKAEGVALRGHTRYEGEHRHEFTVLWDSIYAENGLGWHGDPWVWCCEFEEET